MASCTRAQQDSRLRGQTALVFSGAALLVCWSRLLFGAGSAVEHGLERERSNFSAVSRIGTVICLHSFGTDSREHTHMSRGNGTCAAISQCSNSQYVDCRFFALARWRRMGPILLQM